MARLRHLEKLQAKIWAANGGPSTPTALSHTIPRLEICFVRKGTPVPLVAMRVAVQAVVFRRPVWYSYPIRAACEAIIRTPLRGRGSEALRRNRHSSPLATPTAIRI